MKASSCDMRATPETASANQNASPKNGTMDVAKESVLELELPMSEKNNVVFVNPASYLM